jgi:hypothetical protein
MTGGCQCGAVRFRVARLGRASLCHCRMCQKATGGIGGLYVTGEDVVWTRGGPKHWQSSNRVRRGFCGDCGTPLTFELEGGALELAIPTFDTPAELPPVVQLDPASRLPWADELPNLPHLSAGEAARKIGYYADIVSRQHPDHDTGETQ